MAKPDFSSESDPVSGLDFSSASDPVSAPSTSSPGKISSFFAGAGKGFGQQMLGAQQLLGSADSYLGGKQTGDWLQKNAAQGSDKLTQQAAPYAAAHPFLEGAGEFAGQVIPQMLAAPEAAAGALARIGQGAVLGGVQGAVAPVPAQQPFWSTKAAQVGEGTAAGALGTAVPEGVLKGIKASGIGSWLLRNNPLAVKSAAVQKILSVIQQDEKAGTTKAQDVADLIHKTRAAGVPMTLMEAGGENLKGFAGSVARSKGPAKDIIPKSFNNRIEGSAQRLRDVVTKTFGFPQTMRETHQALTTSQAAASRPLYQKAFEPGSLAPLETHFEGEFDRISQAKKEASGVLSQAQQAVTLAAAKLSRAGNDVYLNSTALEEMRAAQKTVEVAHQALMDVESEYKSTLQNLKAAQQAVANGERGGVYSPYIARLLKNPDVQKGISTGWRIQRNEADGLGMPFQPHDYAVVGEDKDGNPIVGKTPNMRLLDAAKRGLDEMIEGYRDKVTGLLKLDATGRSLVILNKGLIGELDRLNPFYAPARAAFAGPAKAKAAMDKGATILRRHPEDVASIFSRLSPAEQEHFRLGAAQAYMDAVNDGGVFNPAIRRLANNDDQQRARARLSPIFPSKQARDQFLTAVSGERAIADTRQYVVGNSATARRVADDETPDLAPAMHAVHGAAKLKTGNVPGAIVSLLRAKRHLGLVQNPLLNEEYAKLLSDPALALNTSGGPILSAPAMPASPIDPFLRFIEKSSPLSGLVAGKAATQ
jgi:hypothetical protein